jgi:hypothetical protein
LWFVLNTSLSQDGVICTGPDIVAQLAGYDGDAAIGAPGLKSARSAGLLVQPLDHVANLERHGFSLRRFALGRTRSSSGPIDIWGRACISRRKTSLMYV